MRRSQQSRQALGSAVHLTLVFDDTIKPRHIFNALWRQIDAFEQRFSRFKLDSELSAFNVAAGDKQTVSAEFRALLATAKMFAEKTSGLYNPCTLPALQYAGYKGSWPQPQKVDPQLNYENRAVADWRDITIGDTWAQIPADAALDFGGIGKGYLLDRLGETLQAEGIGDYWLSLGGDILCSGHDVSGDAWYVSIADAIYAQKSAGAVKNNGQKLAIATSGTTKRQGIGRAGKWHHIIDPHTGRPAATDVLTATVCSGTATAADIAAKCLVIAGRKHAQRVLKDLYETDALLQAANSTKTTIMKVGAVWE